MEVGHLDSKKSLENSMNTSMDKLGVAKINNFAHGCSLIKVV